MKNIFLFSYPLVSWGGMLLSSLCIVLIIHVVPFLVRGLTRAKVLL